MSARVALVTGGTGGIGTAIVRRLAKMGYKVATNYRSEEKTKAWRDQLAAEGLVADAWVVNGLPLDAGRLEALFKQYPEGLVTIEDGLIGTPESGLRGFAGLVRGAAFGKKLPLVHLGIVDPRIAPSEGHLELWQYFGIDVPSAVAAVKAL